VLSKAVPYFEDDEVGAVTVSVRVANTNTLLNKVFDLEFRIGLSLLLKTLSFNKTVFVTPGPFSLYRARTMVEIGGYDPSNLTEDLEIAYRINKAGYRIENALEATVRTTLPETWLGAYRQRRRWYTGAIQTQIKHRSMLFNRSYGVFGFLIPLNYSIIALGMILFYSSLWLVGSNWFEGLWSLRYTGFNILERLSLITIDPLRIGTVTFTGILGITATILMLAIGLHLARGERAKVPGIIGYPTLFIFYQIFWTGALVAYLSKRKHSWR
jgi:cellulose synthase/poly-beta-1,6-N-acetylglucosamine synthase-like glycosyltransferase